MKLIPLGKSGKNAMVDDEDYEYLTQWKWAISPDGYVRRTTRKGKGYTTVRMHRVLMDAQPGEVVDHEDGNPLNNQKDNLRIATRSQNSCNTRIMRNKVYSSHKGVTYDKSRNKWLSQIQYEGKRYFIGRFASEEEAVNAYRSKAIELHGDFAKYE